MKKKQIQVAQNEKANKEQELELELLKAEQAFATGLRAGLAKACGTVCGTKKVTAT
jgi:hypothetical protein